MQEDEPSTFVTFERFEKKMLEVLYTNEYEPDSDETLLTAFRVRTSQGSSCYCISWQQGVESA